MRMLTEFSTPKMLQEQIDELKEGLKDKNAPFGVDLLLPQVGGSARKTNYDYTHGHLDELIDVIIASGCKLFVSAVGVPPRHVADRLHKAKIPIMSTTISFLDDKIDIRYDWTSQACQEGLGCWR
jgi:NAD(P)H-dependent flavin oxidoreductase YrpB (nitropropane dioxygenase family)